MATSIGSSAAFTSASMKPASGEQIDALWGDNMADNTAFLRAHPTMWMSDYGTGSFATQANTGLGASYTMELNTAVYIRRPPGHNRLVGTYRFDGTFGLSNNPDIYATWGPYLYGNVATYAGTTATQSANISSTYTWGSTLVFELNLDNYLSVGSWGTLILYASGTIADHSTATAFNFTNSVPAKVYTTWAN